MSNILNAEVGAKFKLRDLIILAILLSFFGMFNTKAHARAISVRVAPVRVAPVRVAPVRVSTPAPRITTTAPKVNSPAGKAPSAGAGKTGTVSTIRTTATPSNGVTVTNPASPWYVIWWTNIFGGGDDEEEDE